MTIFPRHLRLVPCRKGKGYCRSGTRKFFKKHNMDWIKFLKEGLPEEAFLQTGDSMAAELVRIAKIWESGEVTQH